MGIDGEPGLALGAQDVPLLEVAVEQHRLTLGSEKVGSQVLGALDDSGRQWSGRSTMSLPQAAQHECRVGDGGKRVIRRRLHPQRAGDSRGYTRHRSLVIELDDGPAGYKA